MRQSQQKSGEAGWYFGQTKGSGGCWINRQLAAGDSSQAGGSSRCNLCGKREKGELEPPSGSQEGGWGLPAAANNHL